MTLLSFVVGTICSKLNLNIADADVRIIYREPC